MKNLVLYILPNPFTERRVVEFEYNGVSSTSIAAISPFFDKRYFNNVIIIAVPDTYSVWPEVGAFPKSRTYNDVLERLQDHLYKKCSFLHKMYCRNAYYIPIPWRGSVGGWQFSSTPGDVTLFFIRGVFEAIKEISPPQDYQHTPVERVVIVYDERVPPLLSTLLYRVGLLVSSITRTYLELVYPEPLQYPVDLRKPPRVKLEILEEQDHRDAIRVVLSMIPSRVGEVFSRKVFIKSKKPLNSSLAKTIEYTEISALFAKNGMTIPLVYNTCGSAINPVSKGVDVLDTLYTLYVENTLLQKKEVGGKIVHGISINQSQLLLFLAGISIENTVLSKLREAGIECNDIYNEGVPFSLLKDINNELGIRQYIENKYIEIKNNKILLKPGSLKKLRKQVLQLSKLV